jgi:hypothetical protein
MTQPIDLLARAMAVAEDAQRLHEISYDLGVIGDQPTDKMRAAQVMLETATCLAQEIRSYLCDHAIGTDYVDLP